MQPIPNKIELDPQSKTNKKVFRSYKPQLELRNKLGALNIQNLIGDGLIKLNNSKVIMEWREVNNGVFIG